MKKPFDYRGRTEAEVLAACRALAHAVEAIGDDTEFIRRFEQVPVWFFSENPELRLEFIRAVPLVLRQLKSMAARGDHESAEML